jgi:glycosyltransferase involved in cell wall biosynthesis
MIGENRMPQAIAERIASHGLQGDVQLLGVKAPERVMEYITAGDISVLYSHSEGNPTVMFESLGCGRPYIGSDVGGVRAVLTDTKIGRYGPARDVDALTSLLEQSLDTEWDEQYIRQQARQYTWEAIAQQTYEQVYRPLLTSRVGER